MIRETEWNGEHYVFEWPDDDNGLWEGPLENWTTGHYPKILELCKKFDVAVQAGGAAGMYPRFLSTMFNRVYTFEPEHINFDCLAANCKGERIIKINAALGNGHYTVDMVRGNPVNAGTHKTRPDPLKHIPTFCIDDLALSKCDLIMLDMEGGELAALNGAWKTIELRPSLIFVENGHEVELLMEEFKYKYIGKIAADSIFVPTE